MIGLGYHGTVTPPVIRRNVLENPAWYTAYTPYQPEISQGRLEALLTFQTTVADLTGLPVAGASLLDEATAAAEAMTLLRRAGPVDAAPRFVVDADTLPQTLEVLRTRAEPLGIELVVADLAAGLPDGELFGAAAVLPGRVRARCATRRPLIDAAHERGALVAVAADLLALTLLHPARRAGRGRRGGHHPALRGAARLRRPARRATSRCAQELARQLPGRLVGLSRDADGNPALRLALQTREQHIRREKATSNICTAQVLLAVVAACYAVYHGPDGLRRIAQRGHRMAAVLAAGLRRRRRRGGARRVLRHRAGAGARAGPTRWSTPRTPPGSRCAGWTPTRVGIACSRADHRGAPGRGVGGVRGGRPTPPRWTRRPPTRCRPSCSAPASTSPTRCSTSTARRPSLMRWLRRLADADLALDRTMIPLGSCTMKLNAAAEMEPITWPGFADLHPFAPDADAAGIRELIADLERWLAELTGYAAVSLQPNAGSQGEFAGLLAIARLPPRARARGTATSA